MFQDHRQQNCPRETFTTSATDLLEFFTKITEALKHPELEDFVGAVKALDSRFAQECAEARYAAESGKWDPYSSAHQLPTYSELKRQSAALLAKLEKGYPINQNDRTALEVLIDFAERSLYRVQHGTTGESGILDTGESVSETYLKDSESNQPWGVMPKLPAALADPS